MKKVNVSIIGITGYTGEELIKLLSKHKLVNLSVLAGRSISERKPLKDIYPHLSHFNLFCDALDIKEISDKSDLIFLALPHKVSFEIVPEFIKLNKRIIDLSADFRLKDLKVYEKWYAGKHTAEALLKESVYGLPEIYRSKIKNARLIANPGCYPTSVLLGCIPALKSGFFDSNSIVIDAKSGISGAGRKSVEEYYKNEHPNFRPYNIAGSHRHIPEIEQELSIIAGVHVKATFTPHILPIERGMISTIYIDVKKKIKSADVLNIYKEFYDNEPFVKILQENKIPDIRDVVNNNYCYIGLKIDDRTNKLIIVSAIDNLLKGASGQAVQNLNIMYGFNEKEGLV